MDDSALTFIDPLGDDDDDKLLGHRSQPAQDAGEEEGVFSFTLPSVMELNEPRGGGGGGEEEEVKVSSWADEVAREGAREWREQNKSEDVRES